MKKILILALALSAAGCASVQMPKGPDTAALTSLGNSAPVLGVEVVDARESKSAGSIGALGLSIKPKDLTRMSSNHLMQYVHDRLNMNVTEVRSFDENAVKQTMIDYKLDGLVLAKVKKVKLFSMDSLMQPVQVDVEFEVSTFDRSGQPIYTETFLGEFSKRIGVSFGTSTEGQLVESAVKNAFNELVKDRHFQATLEGI